MSDTSDDANGRSTPVEPTTNGVHKEPNGTAGAHIPDTVDALKEELARVQKENEDLSDKYSALVNKLSAMRTSVANKLKQDAVRTYGHK